MLDPDLIEYCKQNNITFQAFNVVNGVFYDRDFEGTVLENYSDTGMCSRWLATFDVH